MGITAAVVSAFAASAAAVFAAANLILSGRREHTKWAREALIEIVASYIDLSFDSTDVVKRALRDSAPRSWPPASDAAVRADAKESERQMRRLQSRLRLLAGPEVIDAAQRLRLAVRTHHTLLDVEHAVAIDRDIEMRREIWYLRQVFIDRAKEALALPRSWRKAPRTLPSVAALSGQAAPERTVP
ncbi:hypothetical protein ACFQS1_40255 [Paractinoplanes rhizophilus]|uniref:Uncharacterized protein n=1 Tax=Paractinoplanes rhizophilus TaxID=1416877 RepID=A0ABW2I5V6_9ACTN